MKEIVIASSNQHKVSEITRKIHSNFDTIYSLSDFPEIGEIKEDGNSIRENSFIKSRVTFDYTNIPSLADDTALEVDCLNGDPGLYTARYAGESATYDDNINKLLKWKKAENMMRSKSDFNKVKKWLGHKESTNNYQEENSSGFIGKYQFGYSALIDIGFVKKSARNNDDLNDNKIINNFFILVPTNSLLQ